MTPPAPRARLAHIDLLFVRPLPAARAARSRRGWAAVVAAVTAAGAALRLATLGSDGFSPGEAAYALAARADAWNLHGLLLRGAAATVGAGDAALRAPSAVAGILTIPAVYALVRRAARREVALAAAALVAIAPLHVAASQDARPFAVALLLAALAAHAVAGAIGRARASTWAARAAELRARRRALALAACAALVPVAAAALASATWRPSKADWRGAAAAVEARVRAEDLLLFDRARSEAAYLRYARRADDRLALESAAPGAIDGAIASRRRAWLLLSDARGEDALRRLLRGEWREVDRLHARGVLAVLLRRDAAGAPAARTRQGGE